MSPDWLQQLTGWLAANPGWLAIAVFAIALMESLALVGILVPGVAVLFAVTVLAGKAGTPIAELLIWGAAGAIIGDVLSFWLGRRLKGRLHRFWPFGHFPALIRKAESLFVRHGGISVVIGRFVGPVRPLLPMVAGAFNMPTRHFLLFNIGSAILWAPVYILPGYAVGNTLASPVSIPRELYPLIGISIAALGISYILFFRIQLGLRHQSRTYAWIQQQLSWHPGAERLWQRFSSDRPGRRKEFPLASISLTAAGVAGLLLWLVLTHTTGLPLTADVYFTRLFAALQHPLGMQLTGPVAALADLQLLILASVLVIAVLVVRGHYSAALHWLAGCGLTSAALYYLNHQFAGEAPNLTPDHGTSVPDTSVTLLTLTLGLLAAFIAREQAPAKRWRTYTLLSIPLLFISLSLLYLGHVWFTDVAAGLMLGLSVCGVVRTSFSRHDHEPIPAELLSRLALTVWLLAAVVWIVLAWQGDIATGTFWR